jgi:hypothetical protein
VIEEENQENRESPALQPDEPAPAATDPGFSVPEDAAATGESPAGAQARAESGDESPLERPEVQILGAFVGAFILAKLLQKLFSRD